MPFVDPQGNKKGHLVDPFVDPQGNKKGHLVDQVYRIWSRGG